MTISLGGLSSRVVLGGASAGARGAATKWAVAGNCRQKPESWVVCVSETRGISKRVGRLGVAVRDVGSLVAADGLQQERDSCQADSEGTLTRVENGHAVNLSSAPAAPISTGHAPSSSGSTAGAVLLVNNITLSAGGRDLLNGATWRLMPGDRTGLVGVNGCGKTTLLRSIVGLADVQSGSVSFGAGTEVAYLEQTAVSGSTRTVWEEARSRMTAMNAIFAEVQAAEEAVEKGTEGAIARLAKAQEMFEAVEGYRADEIIASVLNGLGFQTSDWTRSCAEFSGGWQMRIALARLLLSQVGHLGMSLLLLDEPTNHLDGGAKQWLATYLKGTNAAVAIVSHDQEFLEKVCNQIVEIRGARMHHFTGNFSKFLQARAARQEQEAQAYKAKQAEIARLQGFVTRFGAKATKASAANSRKKMIERLKGQLPDSAPEDELGESAGDKRSVKITLPKPPPSAREVLLLRGANVGWDGCPPLLHGINLRLETKMRLVILGPNGCGKSTLMRAMSGRTDLQGGSRVVGMGVEIGVFTQDLAQDLPADVSGMNFVLEAAREKNPLITDGQARGVLGALGLTGDAALRPIGALSGGEKARVALGVFMLRPYNCLLLDEASNHLDRPSVMTLAQSLSKFEGALAAISHDEEFIQALDPTHIARVQPDGSVTVDLCINGDLRPANKQTASTAGTPKPTTRTPTPGAPKQDKINSSSGKDRRRLQQLQTQIKTVVALLDKGEAACAALEQQMMAAGSDAQKALEIHTKKQSLRLKISEAEKEWEALETEAQELRTKILVS